MDKNKDKHYFIYSIVLFSLGFLAMDIVNGSVKDFDNNHFLILAPILLPIVGLFFAVRYFMRARGYLKLGLLLAVLINLGLVGVIFLSYSFSYWQF